MKKPTCTFSYGGLRLPYNVHVNFFIHMNEKTDMHISYGGLGLPYNVHVNFFIHTSRKRKKSTINS